MRPPVERKTTILKLAGVRDGSGKLPPLASASFLRRCASRINARRQIFMLEMTMNARWIKREWPLSLALAALLSAATASGQTVQSIQTLDRVNVYNKTKVLEMEFDDPGRTFDFTALAITPASSAGFVACQVTANRALYCIDGKQVVYWASPSEVAPPNTNGTPLFSCNDPAFGFDSVTSRPCTALTVDVSGAIWLVGKLPASSSHQLFKVVEHSRAAVVTSLWGRRGSTARYRTRPIRGQSPRFRQSMVTLERHSSDRVASRGRVCLLWLLTHRIRMAVRTVAQ
jgi:hypothetical protein